MRSRSMLIVLLLFLASCGEWSSLDSSIGKAANGQACSDKPGVLIEENVKDISIVKGKPWSTSESLTKGQDIGYVFTAQAGQTLAYDVEGSCAWLLLARNLASVGDTELPETGRYILQVSTTESSTTIGVQLGLDLSKATNNNDLSASPPVSTSEEPKPPKRSSSGDADSESQFNEDQATRLVQEYLEAKPELFAPPFNRDLLAKLMTGTRYEDAIRSMRWLQDKNARYLYKTSRIKQQNSFQLSNGKASINVLIVEDRVLYINETVNRQFTTFGLKEEWFSVYFISTDDGNWKISNIEDG